MTHAPPPPPRNAAEEARLRLLMTVEDLHDRAVLSGAESLDGWFTCLYQQGTQTAALTQAYEGQELGGPILVSVTSRAAFDAVVDAAWRFFTCL